MARINIEDRLFRDVRWMGLITKTGCHYKALGLISSAWILAQENWIKHGFIPKKSWPKELNLLIEAELAEVNEEGGVYVKGSKRAFEWLKQRSNSGKSKSHNKTRNLKQNNKKQLNSTERTPNGSRTATEALTLTLTPTLTHSLDHTNSNTVHSEQVADGPKNRNIKNSQLVKEKYFSSFKSRYGTEPVWGVKETVGANRLITSVGLDDALALAEYYPSYIEPWHVKRRHTFSILVAQAHQVLTDMRNIKHVIDSRAHEKNFDDKVGDFQHKTRLEELRKAAELSNIAFKIAQKENPDLKDYQFEYEKFMQAKGLDLHMPFDKIKEVLSNLKPRELQNGTQRF